MPDDQTPRYRFRGSVKPTAEAKRPVRAYRNAASGDGGNGSKSTTATIDIFDVIDSWGGYWGISAAEVDQALAGLGDDITTLYVRINSPGGEATEGIAIANLIRAHAATVHATNYGLAASAASVIAIAGDTLAMAPGSMLMIHKAWNIARGNADDLKAEAAILDKFDESLAALYALKGGSDTDWLALMGAETWFTPVDAVAAKLADSVGITPGPPPANPDDQDEPLPDVDGDTPFDRAARVFDLSVFTNAPTVSITKPPADPLEHPPTPKEAVDMTEEQRKALAKSLGLPEDANAAAIQAKADELLEAATKPADKPAEITNETIAEATGLTAEQVKAALDGARTGKVTLSQVAFEEMQANAKLGADARKEQLDRARDEAVENAIRAGKISRDRRDAWIKAWDADPEGVAADLNTLEARFPVAKAAGYAGSDGSDGEGTEAMTDEESDQLASLAGLPKGALK